MITNRNCFRLVILLATLAVLSACDKKEEKAATQVAAKVNGGEITVTQINSVLARANGVTAENAPAAKNEILDKLIDQQLAVDQAVDKKLDRSPAVMQAIEGAKREILARAYIDSVAAAQPKPGADEIKAFYAEHPELFSQRRLYNFQEIAISTANVPADEIKQLVTSAKTMQDIAVALKAKNIPFRANSGVNAAEQLPLELLPKFNAMKDGDTTLIQGPQGLLVVHLAASQPQPIDEPTAQPRIEQFIANKRNTEAIAKDIKALREKAKIEKLGEFAKAEAAPAPAAPAALPTATQTPAAPAAPAAASAVDDKAIAKGVAGLK